VKCLCGCAAGLFLQGPSAGALSCCVWCVMLPSSFPTRKPYLYRPLPRDTVKGGACNDRVVCVDGDVAISRGVVETDGDMVSRFRDSCAPFGCRDDNQSTFWAREETRKMHVDEVYNLGTMPRK